MDADRTAGVSGNQPLTLFEPAATAEAPPQTPTTPTRKLARELRPRNRVAGDGPRALSSAELIAALIEPEAAEEDPRTLGLAADLVNEAGGLAGLRGVSYPDLTGAGGITPEPLSRAEASKILAAIELGKRMMEAEVEEPPRISSPADVARLLAPRMRGLEHEEFVVLLLDTKNHVLAGPTISVGTLDVCPVHPREVFKPAIKAAAAGVIAVHNHPGGDPAPSSEDRRVTSRLREAGETIGIELLDHVIIGARTHASLKELGMFHQTL